MENQIKYSVIVPVFNSEKSICRCLDSLVCQNREDVQIIVINDGSSDKSEELIQGYVEQYKSICYLSQKNAGVSTARNAGLAHAVGTYITFVDSDDYVAEDYFSVLDQQKECDLLVFASRTDGCDTNGEQALLAKLQKITEKRDVLKSLLLTRKIMPPWNKRYKRALIEEKGIRFIKGMQIGEDFNFCLAYALTCNTVNICAEPVYCVDVSDAGSLSRKYRPNLARDMEQVFQAASAADRNGTYAAELDYLFIKNAFSCIAEEFKAGPFPWLENREKIRKICDVFRKPLAQGYVSVTHRGLRLLLKWRMDMMIYLVAWIVKGRKYRFQVKG